MEPVPSKMHSLCAHTHTNRCTVHTLPKPDIRLMLRFVRSLRWLSANRRELHIHTFFNFMCKIQLCAPATGHIEWKARTELAASPNCIHSSCWKSNVFHFSTFICTLKVWRQSRRLRKVLFNAPARALCSSIYWPFMFDFRKLLLIIMCAWRRRRCCLSHSIHSAHSTPYDRLFSSWKYFPLVNTKVSCILHVAYESVI